MRLRVKFCGMTRVEDAMEATRLGVDAIGLIFYEPSPRHVFIAQAQAIVTALPPFVTTVGVFVNATEDNIRSIIEQVPLDLLQFHGNESAAECSQYGKPYMKAISMHYDTDVRTACETYKDAKALLLDAYHPSLPGGTGEVFDWGRIPKNIAKPIVLAGGLTPENIRVAVHEVHPYGIDVVSGIEAEKGIKDQKKMAAFMEHIKTLEV